MSQTIMRALVTDGLPGNCPLYKFSTNFRDAHRGVTWTGISLTGVIGSIQLVLWLPGQTKCTVVLGRPEPLEFQGKMRWSSLGRSLESRPEEVEIRMKAH